MNEQQLKRLTEVETKLVNVFLEEADPDLWAQVDPKTDAKEQQKARGDRYWQAKVANQTIALLTRIEAYRSRTASGKQSKPDDTDDREVRKDIQAAEKKVRERLSLVKKRAC